MLKHHRDLPAILLILAVTVPLFGVGIDWGMPNHYSYAPDAVSPLRAIDALGSYFDTDRSWADKYPPGHFYLVGLLCQPFLSWCESGPEGAEFAAAVQRVLEGSTKPGWARVENHAAYLKTFMKFRPRMTLLIMVGRGLSFLMGIGAILLLYGIGRRLGGIVVGLTGALLAASYAPTIFHAHTMNVDIPYVFWLMLAFYLLVRTLQVGSSSSALFAGAAAAMAVATKDQAYGMLMAAPVLFFAFWWRPHLLSPDALRKQRKAGQGSESSGSDRPAAAWGGGADPLPSTGFAVDSEGGAGGAAMPRRTFPAKSVAFALLGFAITFVVANNLLFQWSGYREHLHYIFTQGSQPYRTHEASPFGQVRLFSHSVSLLFETMPWLGVPYLGAVPLVVGLAIGLVLRPARSFFALLPSVTYYIAFVAQIGYCYARFLIPVVFFLALPGGFLFRDLIRVGQGRSKRNGSGPSGAGARRRWVGPVFGCLVFTSMFGGGARSLQALLNDPRDHATDWLSEHLRKGDVVLTYADKLFTGPKLPDGTSFEIVVVKQDSGGAAKLVVIGRGAPTCLKELPLAFVVSSSFHPSFLTSPPRVGDEQPIFGFKTRVVAVFGRAVKHPVLDQIRINPTVIIYEIVR